MSCRLFKMMTKQDKKPKMYNNQVKHQSTACVRDTEHADRQCAALAEHRSVSVVRSSPTRSAAKGHAQK
ncbi:MAG: hypothetical protein RML94_15140 [Bacteroidia bacterium]|nr:hypothetical protein [Bacteroidia bacterium]